MVDPLRLIQYIPIGRAWDGSSAHVAPAYQCLFLGLLRFAKPIAQCHPFLLALGRGVYHHQNAMVGLFQFAAKLNPSTRSLPIWACLSGPRRAPRCGDSICSKRLIFRPRPVLQLA